MITGRRQSQLYMASIHPRVVVERRKNHQYITFPRQRGSRLRQKISYGTVPTRVARTWVMFNNAVPHCHSNSVKIAPAYMICHWSLKRGYKRIRHCAEHYYASSNEQQSAREIFDGSVWYIKFKLLTTWNTRVRLFMYISFSRTRKLYTNFSF